MLNQSHAAYWIYTGTRQIQLEMFTSIGTNCPEENQETARQGQLCRRDSLRSEVYRIS